MQLLKPLTQQVILGFLHSHQTEMCTLWFLLRIWSLLILNSLLLSYWLQSKPSSKPCLLHYKFLHLFSWIQPWVIHQRYTGWLVAQRILLKSPKYSNLHLMDQSIQKLYSLPLLSVIHLFPFSLLDFSWTPAVQACIREKKL